MPYMEKRPEKGGDWKGQNRTGMTFDSLDTRPGAFRLLALH